MRVPGALREATRRRLRWGAGAGTALALAATAAAAPLAHRALELPGLPVAFLSADLDGDGWRELAIVSAGARWGEIGVEERSAIDEGGVLVEVLTVVPALFDRREVTVLRGAAVGFAAAPLSLELPPSVRGLDSLGVGAPLVAWSDEGVSELALADDGRLALVARLPGPPLFAGAEGFLPPLGLASDLDGSGSPDLLVPREAGLAVHLGGSSGLATEPAAVLRVPLEERLPGDARHYAEGAQRSVPLPVARDLDGDGLPELLFRGHESGWNELRILRNLGGGKFSEPIDPLAGRDRAAEPRVVYVGDLDGDGRGELVTAEALGGDGGSLREELRAARAPRFRYAVHALDERLRWREAPARRFELAGYLFTDDDGHPAAPGARDLDGDGRVDLVALRLDVSLFEAARAFAARAVEVGLEFDLHCQTPGGDFVLAASLAAELRLRLDALALSQLASFAGDFDGDGRADFLRLGPGRRAEVFRGEAGCRYGERPALAFELVAPPADAALIVVRDFDGDGRSDLAVTRPRRGPGDVGLGAVVDLYLSRGSG